MEPAPFKDMSQQFVETLMLIRQNFYRQTAVPIPLSQFGVLCVLAADGSSSITDISHNLNIAKQQMTTVINKLVEAGLVEKTADIHDCRRVVITMTTVGQARLTSRTNWSVSGSINRARSSARRKTDSWPMQFKPTTS